MMNPPIPDSVIPIPVSIFSHLLYPLSSSIPAMTSIPSPSIASIIPSISICLFLSCLSVFLGLYYCREIYVFRVNLV